MPTGGNELTFEQLGKQNYPRGTTKLGIYNEDYILINNIPPVLWRFIYWNFDQIVSIDKLYPLICGLVKA